jgi:hypothetical protein
MRDTDVLYHSTKKSVSQHVENFTMVHIYLVPAVPSTSSVLLCPIPGESARFLVAALGTFQNV